MLGQMIVQQIVKQIVPTGVIQNGNVHINTGSVHKLVRNSVTQSLSMIVKVTQNLS